MAQNHAPKTLEAGGKSLQLVFSFRAMFFLQDEWKLEDDPKDQADGKTADQKVMDRVTKASLRDVVDVVWAMTRSEHPDLAREDVLELLDKRGFNGLPEILATVISAAEPPATAKKKATAPPR